MRVYRKRVSISLPADLLAEIDDRCRMLRETRSGLMEEWLRQMAVQAAQLQLDREIAAYYRGAPAAQRVRDEESVSAFSGAARGLRIDDSPGGRPPRKPKRVR